MVKGNIINQTNPENYPFGYFRLSEIDSTTYIACPFRVGASSASTAADFFKGKMDDFRISKRARYPVTTTMSGASTSTDSNLWRGRDHITVICTHVEQCKRTERSS